MANTINAYPLTKFYFEVVITDASNNRATISFQQVTGLEGTRDKAEYRSGLQKGFVKQQIPGMKTFGELTLKRGTFDGHNEFFSWWEGTPMPDRRDISISLLNPDGLPIVTWKVVKAFPTKFTSTELDAQNNEIAIETLVLAHEGITVENSGLLE